VRFLEVLMQFSPCPDLQKVLPEIASFGAKKPAI
jgi:hypothetical protein